MTHYLAVDVEATGMGLRTHFMTALGAVLLGPDGEIARDNEGKPWRFESYLAQPEGTTWEQRCLDEFWLQPKMKDVYEKTLAEVARARPADEVMREFKDWCFTIGTIYDDVRICLDTASFDGAWVNFYLGNVSLDYVLGRREMAVDVNSFLMGKTWQKLDGSSRKAVAALSGGGALPEWMGKHDHHPANDAFVTAKKARLADV